MAARAGSFDPFTIPLEGTVRIEASAGTGKTHTLADLYLRLVAEGRSVEQILAVTYTVAATGELRDRLRHRLVEARAHLEGRPSGDPALRRFLERSADRPATGRRLTAALHDIDQAAVSTIHGFCQRALADFAFESGQPFTSELLPDEQALLQEVVDDFWRCAAPRWSPLAVDALLEAGLTPESLRRCIGPLLGQPDLRVDAPDPPDLPAAEAAYAAAYRTLREIWPAGREAVGALLATPGLLHAGSYPPGKIPAWLEAVDDFLTPAEPHLGACGPLEKLTARKVAAAVRKGKRAPAHPFFAACDALLDAGSALRDCLIAGRRRLLADCLAYAGRELSLRKRQRNLRGYADLLTDLASALAGPRGGRLADSIRMRHSAALIDEFQDTDPVQYRIFQRIFAETSRLLVLVGDPKQAIYGFRGADVFAYLGARRDPGTDWTLVRNWRADPPLIGALNMLWSRPRDPFLLPEIRYEAVRPAEREREPLVVEGDGPEPLRVWMLPARADGKPCGKGEAAGLAIRATVAEIVRLLTLGASGRARIGDRPLAGGDLAVLVRSNLQGRQLRDALLACRVPAVQLVQDSVFDSEEAEGLSRVLQAVAEPNRDGAIRAALTTDLFGLTGDDLDALTADEAAWEGRIESFRADHERWQAAGFAPMMRELMRREGMAARLLRFPDGERRLTNLSHLVELLQEAADGSASGMTVLIRWLADRRRGGGPAAAEAQLRLESDENLVKIVTVHKSKGLEYPVVFCPFLWDGRLGTDGGETLRYHDPADGHRAVLDLGSSQGERARRQARREELSESLRLCYVALTRARHRCTLVWGHVNEGGTSPLAHLLHPSLDPVADPLNASGSRVETLDPERITAELKRLQAESGGTIAVVEIPQETPGTFSPPAVAPSALAARAFAGRLTVPWRLASFSALRREVEAGAEGVDDDRSAPAFGAAVSTDRSDFAGFPRGARAGSCLHAVLERIDFAAPAESRNAVVAEILTAHGFARAWTPAVGAMLERVLACPLDPGPAPLCLRRIGRQDRLDEMEFTYPAARVTTAGLRRLLLRHGYGAGTRIREEVDRLTFAPVEGYVRGFIDLVVRHDGRFNLVDYKSNWLGDGPEAYRPEQLTAVMAGEGYYLQSLIYLAALHRYLTARLTGYAIERHLGGAYFLFLRGMDPAQEAGAGIHRDRPDPALVLALDRYLKTGEEA